MRKVKQITLDILELDGKKGIEIAKDVKDILEENGIIVLGSDFSADLTDDYEKHCPEILNDNCDNENKQMRIIEVYGDMTGEYELIWTNTSNDLIEEWLRIVNYLEECSVFCKNPYALLENSDCVVVIIGSQDDDINDKYIIDYCFNKNEYSYDGNDIR